MDLNQKMTKSLKNHLYTGYNNRQALIDLEIPEIFNGKLILFAHGFMGYKDWGAWSLVQDYFTDLGFGFCKFNFSHNGTTPESPTAFTDLEAFSIDSYWKEHCDINAVIQWLKEKLTPFPSLFLLGHSQGGGIVLTLSKHPLVERIVTWAAVSDFAERFPTGKALEEWKENGFHYRMNSRTNQNMPLAFERYTDFEQNKHQLDIREIVEKSSAQLLFIHGESDTSVLPEESKNLALWSKQECKILANTAHTFDSKEPWESLSLPTKLLEACTITASFFLLSKHYAHK